MDGAIKSKRMFPAYTTSQLEALEYEEAKLIQPDPAELTAEQRSFSIAL